MTTTASLVYNKTDVSVPKNLNTKEKNYKKIMLSKNDKPIKANENIKNNIKKVLVTARNKSIEKK